MSDTARIECAVELLGAAQVRLGLGGGGFASRDAYVLVDAALWKLRDELADRMLAEASAEIAGIVDLHGLIDDVAGDDRRLGFE